MAAPVTYDPDQDTQLEDRRVDSHIKLNPTNINFTDCTLSDLPDFSHTKPTLQLDSPPSTAAWMKHILFSPSHR